MTPRPRLVTSNPMASPELAWAVKEQRFEAMCREVQACVFSALLQQRKAFNRPR